MAAAFDSYAALPALPAFTTASLRHLLRDRATKSFNILAHPDIRSAFDSTSIASPEGDSRVSFDSSHSWTQASSVPSPNLGSALDFNPFPESHRPASADHADSTESEYSPSLGSVRQAVVRTRSFSRDHIDPSSSSEPVRFGQAVSTDDLKVSAGNNDEEAAIRAAQIRKGSAASAVTYRPARPAPPKQYRHSASASSSSVSSSASTIDEDKPLSGYGSLLPGPAKGQRMQSFLAPKMKIISPPPWGGDEEDDGAASRKSSDVWSSGGLDDDTKSIKPRGLGFSALVGRVASPAKGQMKGSAADAPFLDMEDSKQRGREYIRNLVFRLTDCILDSFSTKRFGRQRGQPEHTEAALGLLLCCCSSCTTGSATNRIYRTPLAGARPDSTS